MKGRTEKKSGKLDWASVFRATMMDHIPLDFPEFEPITFNDNQQHYEDFIQNSEVGTSCMFQSNTQ